MTRIVSLFVTLFLSSAVGVGCNSQNTPTAEVSGTVSFNGTAVQDGIITFEKAGEPPATLAITDGKFSGSAQIGENKIRVFAYKKAEKSAVAPSGPGAEGAQNDKINFLPDDFNNTSQLKETITVDGDNTFTFDLKK